MIFDIIAYIPTKGIQMTFMNTSTVLDFVQAGKAPEAFQAEAHQKISEAFCHLSMGRTPTRRTLERGFRDAAVHGEIPTTHYLLTDGCPSDCSVGELVKLINKRQNPERNPITLISCTNVDSECEWMKEVMIMIRIHDAHVYVIHVIVHIHRLKRMLHFALR